MKNSTRNSLLVLIALAGMAVYILACTSFSPDDMKVVYPGVDRQSGRIGIAVYDREAKESKLLFVPAVINSPDENDPNALMLRAQFLADGRGIVVTWMPSNFGDRAELGVATVPLAGAEPVRLFQLADVEEAEALFMRGLAIAGNRLFLTRSNKVLRLDLRTGGSEVHSIPELEGELSLYPSDQENMVMYLESKEETGQMTFGRMDAGTFAMTPMITFTNSVAEGSFFAYNKSGRRIGFVEEDRDESRLVVQEKGKEVFRRRLGGKGSELHFASGVFSGNGDRIIAAYRSKMEGATNVSYGIMEVPLSQAPIRQTVLIPKAEDREELDVVYFQAAVSHDGTMAAVASTYLACEDETLQKEDCALFLVDLHDPERKITRIAIQKPGRN